MQCNSTIIYTGNFSIENMNAAGKRVFSNALIMKQLGYHMVMVGVDPIDNYSSDILMTKSDIGGIEIFHYPGKLFSTCRSNYYAFYNQIIKLIEQCNWNVVAIIGYNSPSTAPFIGKMQKYCRRNRIKYITDVADWLIVDSDNPLFKLARQADIELKNTYYTNKSDGVIAISTYLEDYYKKRVKNTIVIPPVAFERKINMKPVNEVPYIVYAGIPFRKGAVMKQPAAMKDRFDIACELLRCAKENGIPFVFQVYGFTKDEMLYSVPALKETIEKLDNWICFHGMASMETVQQAVSNADYTILIRDRNRMTMAGFPTKVSESVTCGTPVITTKTSDIEKYLPEGRGAFFIDMSNNEESSDKVIKLLQLSPSMRTLHKNVCLEITAFDVDTYLDAMRSFLDSVLKEE